MARIAGVDLPKEKRVEIGLTYIYGVGLSTSQKILATTGINPDTRIKDLTEDEVNEIRNYVNKNLMVEGDLRRDVKTRNRAEENCLGLRPPLADFPRLSFS